MPNCFDCSHFVIELDTNQDGCVASGRFIPLDMNHPIVGRVAKLDVTDSEWECHSFEPRYRGYVNKSEIKYNKVTIWEVE